MLGFRHWSSVRGRASGDWDLIPLQSNVVVKPLWALESLRFAVPGL